jgi:hypothetical protein
MSRRRLEELQAENRKLKELLQDKQYVQLLADYNKGHLSHYGWLRQRDGGIRDERLS